MGRHRDRSILDSALSMATGLVRLLVRRDWPGRPVYGLWDRGVGLTLTGDALGCTTSDLSLVLRPQLERAGRWRGPGLAYVLSLDGLRRELGDAGPSVRRERALLTVLAVSLHEAAHILDAGLTTAMPEATRAARAGMVAAYWGTPHAPVEGLPPWLDHETRWIRACAFLASRARGLADLDVTLDDLLNPEVYELSPGRAYAAATAAEVAEGCHLPIARAIATPNPAVEELFRLDQQRYFKETVHERSDRRFDEGGRAVQPPAGAAEPDL